MIDKEIFKNKWILAQRKTYCYPAPMVYAIGIIYSDTMKKVLKGVSFELTLAIYKNGVMYWWAPEGSVERVNKKSLELIEANPNYTLRVIKKFKKIQKEILSFTYKEIFLQNLSKFSNKKLWQLYKKYLRLYDKVYTFGEPLTLGVKDSVILKLKEYLKPKIKNKKRLLEVITLLTSPCKKSFVKKEEDDLLKIALEIEKERKLKKKFLSLDISELKEELKKWPKIKKLIKTHTKKYCWVPYDYGVYLWDEIYFLGSLKEILKSGKVKERIQQSEEYYRKLKILQKELIRKYKINRRYQAMFRSVRDCIFLLDYKKEIFTKTHYHIKILLEEIGRRLGISKDLVQFYLPAELEKALILNKIIPKKRLENRFKKFTIFWKGREVKTYEGKYVEKIDKFLNSQKQETKSSLLDGTIASPGKVVGKVKIVLSAKEISKVKKGDILVAPMTSPDYMPAIKKCIAIITDEGGITCHAAIISRELGIPCVIGTKIATKVLKDGDLVEVNANHGSVKIIKL